MPLTKEVQAKIKRLQDRIQTQIESMSTKNEGIYAQAMKEGINKVMDPLFEDEKESESESKATPTYDAYKLREEKTNLLRRIWSHLDNYLEHADKNRLYKDVSSDPQYAAVFAGKTKLWDSSRDHLSGYVKYHEAADILAKFIKFVEGDKYGAGKKIIVDPSIKEAKELEIDSPSESSNKPRGIDQL